jgi:superfamily II DNA/RNA helicase
MGGSEREGLSPEELAKQEAMIHSVVSPTLKEAAGRPTLVFCVTKAHAERMAEVFSRHPGVTSACITDDTPTRDRRDIVQKFQRGQIQILTGVGVFTEGFDAPSTAVVAMARPTKSLGLYCQMLGRGTRPLPGIVDGPATPEERREAIANSAKPHMTVLDFCGNAGRHKLITSFDVLCGGADERDVLAALAKAKNDDGEPVPVTEAVEKAKLDREAKEEAQRERLRLAAEEAARRAKLRVDAKYRAYESSPFERKATPDIRVGTYRGTASADQVNYLVKLGVPRATAQGYSKSQAGAVLSELLTRTGPNYVMRFGKHSGKALKDIPKDYLRWARENVVGERNRDLAGHIDAALGRATTVHADYPSGATAKPRPALPQSTGDEFALVGRNDF